MEISAAVLRTADGPYTIERVQLADPRDDQILVRIVGAGMCHTDVLPRSPASRAALPIITGHEGAGVVEAVGAAVTHVAVGDHVVLTFDSCGTCPACTNSQPAYCETFLARNLSGRELDGTTSATDAAGEPVSSRWFGQSSFATHAIANERNAVVVDPGLPLELLGPLGCGIQTGAGSILVAMDVQPGSSIAIFGTGAVGLAAVMAAHVAGAETIIAIDLHQHRLDLAIELGATHTIRAAEEGQTVEQIHAMTNGGAHYSFDTTGTPFVMREALLCLRMTGVCGFVGIQTAPLELQGIEIIGKTVLGILEGSVDPHGFIPRMIDLWRAGRFPIDRLIETFPIAAINEAERSSLSVGVIKPVLLP